MERLHVLLVLNSGTDAIHCRDAFYKTVANALVDVVRGSSDALARLEQLSLSNAQPPYFDAVIVDSQSSEMPVADLFGQIRQILPAVPIVALRPPEAVEATADLKRAGAVEVLPKSGDFSWSLATVVKLLVERRFFLDEIERQKARTVEISSRDELTSLSNRRRFKEALDLEIERSRRFHRPLSLVLFDLDAFRLINDTHGHTGGDAALKHIAACLRSEIRRYEIAARVGGDEFAVLLVDTNYDQARVVADKLRRIVADTAVHPIGQVTVSGGIASVPAHATSPSELLRIADQALFDAKAHGTNRILVSRDLRTERSGDRHPIRFKIVVKGRDSRGEIFVEETETELVSRRGARIFTSHTVAIGEQVELRTPYHEQALHAQITSCYRGSDNRWRVGFKLLDPPRWSG